jgi:hypothetical protein
MVDTTGNRKPLLVLLIISIVGISGLLAPFRSVHQIHLTASYFPLILVLEVLSGSGIATFSVGTAQVRTGSPRASEAVHLGSTVDSATLHPSRMRSEERRDGLAGWTRSVVLPCHQPCDCLSNCRARPAMLSGLWCL